MTNIRYAILSASLQRYVVMLLNIGTTLVLARLLTPEEYGVFVLATVIFGFAEALREIGGGSYLIQHRELTTQIIRTTFTVNLIVSLTAGIALCASATQFETFFGARGLQTYMIAASIAFVMGPLNSASLALMSRRLAFRSVAMVGVAMTFSNSVATIFLAVLGFSYMSFAWGSVLSAIIGAAICLVLQRDLSIFQPSLKDWRGVVTFGFYNGIIAILYRIGDSVPFLIFGRILSLESVGLAQRAVLICLVPERGLLAGVRAVALPAFSQDVRDGKDVKLRYLRAIESITAIHWPALTLLVFLAQPTVSLLLGSLWIQAVPLIQILGIAFLFSFPVILQDSTLLAAGGIRYLPILIVVQSSIAAACLAFFAPYGLIAAATSMLFVVPLNVSLSLFLLRAYVRFTWSEFLAALRKSTVITILSASGPALVIFSSGWSFDISMSAALVALILSAAGWGIGAWVTKHPIIWDARQMALNYLRTNSSMK